MAAVLMEQVRLVRRLLAVAGFLSAEREVSGEVRQQLRYIDGTTSFETCSPVYCTAENMASRVIGL